MPMTEELLRIRVDELTKIRLVHRDGDVHEVPLENISNYVHDPKMSPPVGHAIQRLAEALKFLSANGHEPSVEFLIPIKR
jgi:hypothetical protein